MIHTLHGITLIGTAHISSKSATLVTNTIKNHQPGVVAVELDSMRLQSLLEKHQETSNDNNNTKDATGSKKSKKKPKTNNSKMIKQVGLFGFMFIKIAGYAQQKMGRAFHIEPGIDMLAGVNAAKEFEIPLCLADRPILHTIAEFKKLSLRQKLSMMKRMIFSNLSYEERKELAQNIQQDNIDEDTILKIISTLKDNVPELYNILIHKRNEYMVNKLIQLKDKGFENIVIVIGAGHMPGMIELLENRLGKENKKDNSNATQMSFTLEE
ncbi:MAG: TraB/GumN family protein [Candidatus Nanoarchaeia archaeon]